jgi:hypothetical protein
MPDWLAHLMLGFIIGTALRMPGKNRFFLLLGSIMPDLVRFFGIAFTYFNWSFGITYLSNPLNTSSHSVLGVLAYALLLSVFFPSTLGTASTTWNLGGARDKWRWLVDRPLFLLVFGGLLHLLLDSIMWPYAGGIDWLYPLSTAPFIWSFGLMWPGTFVVDWILFPFFLAAVIVELALWERRRSSGGKSFPQNPKWKSSKSIKDQGLIGS